MSKQATKTINNKTYVINAFKGLEGWSYLPRLTKYVFPFVTFMLNPNQEEDELISQVTELLSGENAKEVEKLILELISKVQVDNSNIDPDTEFQQNYDAIFLLAVEVIKLNYLDSFQRLVSNFQ